MAPIEHSDPEAAANYFVQHLNEVLARTITGNRLVASKVGVTDKDRKANFLVEFESASDPGEAVLQSDFGELRLYVAQTCFTEPASRRKHRLHTREYRYYLTPVDQEPLFRWEYTRFPAGQAATICRHHLQGTLPFTLGGQEMTLNDVHVPTGYVPIEEIVRFCIGELGVPPRQTDWADVLEESYRRFREEFAQFGSV